MPGPESINDIPKLPNEDANPVDRAGDVRDETFKELATLSSQLSDVDESNLSRTGRRRLAHQRESLLNAEREFRLESVEPIIAEVARNESASIGVKASVIREIEQSAIAGAHPENIAFEELIHQETENLNTQIERETQLRVADQLAAGQDLDAQVQAVVLELQRATDPSIPFIETGFEFVTSRILGFLIDDGFNINRMLEKSLGIKDPGPDISARDNIKAGAEVISRMTNEEKKEALAKMRTYALNNTGLLLDNGWTVDSLNSVIQTLFGSKMEANILANENGMAQMFGLLTSATAARAGQVAGRAINSVGTGGKVGKAVKGAKATPDAASGPSLSTEVGTTTARSLDSAPVSSAPAPPGSSIDDLRRFNSGEGITPGIRLNLTDEFAPDSVVPTGTPAKVVAETSPSLSRELLRDAVQSNDTAQRLGTNSLSISDDYIQWLTPGQPVRRGPNLLDFSVEGTARALTDGGGDPIFHDFKGTTPEDLAPLATNRDLVSGLEVNKAAQELSQKLADDDSVAIKKFRINEDADEGIVADYILSKESGVGFSSVDEANEYISRQLDDADVNDATVLGYDPATRTYRAGVEGPEYLVQVNYRRNRGSIAQKEDLLKRRKNGNIKFNLFPRLTNGFDTTIGYIERFARGVTRSSNNIGTIAKTLREDVKPIFSMSLDDQHAAWQVLRREESEGEVFTRTQLVERLTPEQRRGYYSVRRFYDRVHGVRNDVYRTALQRAGFRTLTIDGQPDAYVKPFTGELEDINTVWLQSEGRIVDRDYIKEKGLQVDYFESHLMRKNEDGTEGTDFIATTQGEARTLPLPTEVLIKRPGYLGRNIETKFIVYDPGSIRVNGRTTSTVGNIIRVSDDAVSANEFVARANLKQGTNLKVRLSKENVDRDVGGALNDEIKNLGELGMLNHSYARTDLHKLDVTAQHALKTPEEMIEDTISTTARTTGTNELINYSITKFMKNYGQPLGLKEFRWGEEIKAPTTDTDTINLAQQANIVRNKIEQMAGFSHSQISRKMRQSMLMQADRMARLAVNHQGKGKASKAFEAMSRVSSGVARDWVSDVTRANFIRHIGLQPLRQAMQNVGMTFMYGGIKHASEYFGTGRAALDTMTIAAMKLTENSPKLIRREAEFWSKRTGEKPEEIIQVYEDMKASGVLNITDHQFLESMSRSAFTTRSHAGNTATDGPRSHDYLGTTGRLLKTGLRASTRVGFEGSEQFNRMAAFLVMRNRAVKEGEYDGNALKIGEDAAILAGNMGQVNKTAFQSGNWRLLFQFQSHTIKMMQYMVSDIPNLDAATKLRMLAWNTAAFGTRGLGWGGATMAAYHTFLKDAAEDEGVGLEPDHIKILTDGMSSWLYNSMLEELTGQDSNVSLGGDASPISGVFSDLGFLSLPSQSDTTGKIKFKPVPVDGGGRTTNPISVFAKMGIDIMSRAPVDWGEYIGVSDNLIGTGVNWLDNVLTITRAKGFTADEKGQALFQETLKVIPAFNNIARSRMIAATGTYADRHGNPLVRATTADAISKALFGITPDAQDKYWKLRSEWGTRVEATEGTDREWQSTGRDLANRTVFMIRALNEGQIPKEEYLDGLHGLASLIDLTYGQSEHAKDVIWAAALKRLEDVKMSSTTTAFDEMAISMLNDEELIGEKGIETVRRRLLEVEGPQGLFLQKELDRIKSNSGF